MAKRKQKSSLPTPKDEAASVDKWVSGLDTSDYSKSLPQAIARGTVLIKVFERETEKREAFQVEFARQIQDLDVCGEPDCDFHYMTDEIMERMQEGREPNPKEPDIVVRMLVHHYLHMIRDADAKVALPALNRVSEMLSPSRDRVASAGAERGLSEEEYRQLRADVETP